jgi:pimeloyl-ACP methyl ester carboxylesterase
LYSLFLLVSINLSAQKVSIEIKKGVVGKQAFYFDNGGKLKSPLKVYYFSPKANIDSLPIVILMHGAHRDASAYIDGLVDAATVFNCVIVAPEFDKDTYPETDMYNLGNVYSKKGHKFNAKEEWTFELIEPLFDEVVKQIKSTNKGYYMYGHSAGGQFVTRFLMFEPENRIIRAAAANPGWYTLPSNDVDFPYGLKKSNVPSSNIPAMYSKKLFLLLGTADIIRENVDFNSSAQADAQGKNRFERGQFFFKMAKDNAIDLKTPFRWTEVFVPGIGHNNEGMSKFALSLFFMDIK